MSDYTNPNTYFDWEAIEDQMNEVLNTKLNFSQFLTIDNTLEAQDGMTIKIHRYSASGDVEDVSEGEGNTGDITISYAEYPYEVTTTQGRFPYTDEQIMTDRFSVDEGIKAVASKLVNDYNDKAVAEYEKCTNKIYTGANTDIAFDHFADALAKLNLEDADEAGFFALVNPGMKAKLRKALKDDLQYVEAFVREGYVGTVCGIPVYTSKAVSDNEVIVANKQAVTCFTKRNTQVAGDRNENQRVTWMYARNVKVIALTRNDKCCLIKLGAQPTQSAGQGS